MMWMNETNGIPIIQDKPRPHRTERKIEGFQTKQYGWHYGEGVAFAGATLDRAISLHREVLRQDSFRTNAFPGLRGQVLVTVYRGNHYLEFSVEPDGTVAFLHEVDDQEIDYREQLAREEIRVIISQFGEEIWTQSGSSAQSFMIKTWVDSRAVFLTTQVDSREAYQSSTGNVFLDQVQASASIYDIITV